MEKSGNIRQKKMVKKLKAVVITMVLFLSLYLGCGDPVSVNADSDSMPEEKAAFNDTKSWTAIYRCPGTYYIYRSVAPQIDNYQCMMLHETFCVAWGLGRNDAVCVPMSNSFRQYTYDSTYGLISARVGHDCSGMGGPEEGNISTRTRVYESRCNVCHATDEDASYIQMLAADQDVHRLFPGFDTRGRNGGNIREFIGTYGGVDCKQNPSGGHDMIISDIVDGTIRCARCGYQLNTSYKGKCHKNTSQTKIVSWNTQADYTDPVGTVKSDEITGDDDTIIVVKYDSNAKISVKSPLTITGGHIVGYEVYINGVKQKSAGTLDNNKDTDKAFSECFYSMDKINNRSDVRFKLYTQAGTYTLPVITVVPRFHWIDYDLSDGGHIIDGENTTDMSSGGQALLGENSPRMGIYTTPFTVPNPTRPGFTFLGWMIENMDDGTKKYEEITSHYHYWSKTTAGYDTTDYKTQKTSVAGALSGIDNVKGKDNVTYVPAAYTSFLDLRVDVGRHVKFTAVWQDNDDPTLGSVYNEYGATYKNIEDGTNPDTMLSLATQNGSYTITRSDGTRLTRENVLMNEKYVNAFPKLYVGLNGEEFKIDTDFVYHKHAGDPSEQGGCYTNPVYHEHSDDCYDIVRHSHTDSCYTPVYHVHTGDPETGGGCYTLPVYHVHTDRNGNKGEEYVYSYTDPGGCYVPTGRHVHFSPESIYQPHDPNGDYCLYYSQQGKYVCERTENTEWKAACGKEGFIEGYALNCGFSLIPGQEDKGMIEGYALTCGREEGEEESRILTCTRTAGDIDRYDPGCGKTEKTIESVISVTKGGEFTDYVDYTMYPNYYGKTADGSRYYVLDGSVAQYAPKYPDIYEWLDDYKKAVDDRTPVVISTSSEYPDSTTTVGDTRGWTSKTVTVTATAYDGSDDHSGKQPVPSRGGGTGILRMQFDKDGWINNEAAPGDNSSMSVTKTFKDSGVYEGTITVEDNAGTKLNVSAGDTHNAWVETDNKKNHTSTYVYGKIRIDKDAPKLLDPSKMDDSTQKFRDAMMTVYEGYNNVYNPEDGDKYGWSMDNVRVVIYADDSDEKYGMGSGIAANAFCWNKDPNIASNWQSADRTREYIGEDGKSRNIPVSTRVVTQNESGYVYVRDAVGNISRMDYTVDHIDKQAPDTYPDKDPDKENDDPLPPDPLDPEDPDNEDYKPVPDGPYNFEASVSKNELHYDWINHNATVTFHAVDYAVGKDDKKGTDASKFGSSGTYRMLLYRSNKDFPTEKETLKSGVVRERAKKDLYGSNTLIADVTFKDTLTYVEKKEGISYYILEVLDKAENLTTVKLTVKIDKTYPGIPYLHDGEEVNRDLYTENGHTNSNGNDVLDHFPGESFADGSFWTIRQADLNEADYNEVESFIADENNMKCSFTFKIFDRNWTGNYADETVRKTDDSGYDRIVLRLIDADDNGMVKDYTLYDYADHTKAGTASDGDRFDLSYAMTENTNENKVAFLKEKLSGTPVADIMINAKINTFADFPDTAALNYELEITDRAGNVKTYLNQPGNEIRNFSIKAVLYSAEESEYDGSRISEFNERADDYNSRNTTSNQTNVIRKFYEYENRRGEKRLYAYELNAEELKRLGLKRTETAPMEIPVDVDSTVESSVISDTNIPYYQLGDVGYAEIWTVGYVPKVQFNFAAFGDNAGTEMVNEIKDGTMPEKYNLGVTYDTDYDRILPYTAGNAVPVSYASADAAGIPFATHYGVTEKSRLDGRWEENGSAIRMPAYLPLQQEGIDKYDSLPVYKSEFHSADFYALKKQWRDTSSAGYIIYDTRGNDTHYRITHES